MHKILEQIWPAPFPTKFVFKNKIKFNHQTQLYVDDAIWILYIIYFEMCHIIVFN
jgi:predicted SprT family Zn-dependent metalloprotease